VRRRLALLLTAALVPMFSTAACGEGPEEPTQEEQAREETPQEARIEEEAKEGLREKQQASYYGEEFAGDRRPRESLTTRTVSRRPIRTCRWVPSLW